MLQLLRRTGLVTFVLWILGGCASHEPMPTVPHVDLDRFMGDWYVIANIPTFLEENAYNALESYQRNEDGSIATRFSFRAGGFDGERKEYHPTGYVLDTDSNARWGMQFIWPIRADYRIVYLDPAYSRTIIGRQARDYVWIMARTPDIPQDEYDALLRQVGELGYDTSAVQRVPQRW